MYIQLCNNNDCHGNDYDAFGKRRDRIGGWRDRIGCCGDGHGGLVTVETGARVGWHESTYRTIRGHVTYDTRRQWWPAHGQRWSARRRRGVVGRRKGVMGERRGVVGRQRTTGDGGWDSRGRRWARNGRATGPAGRVGCCWSRGSVMTDGNQNMRATRSMLSARRSISSQVL